MQYRLACPKLEPLGIRAGDWCSFPRWEGTIMMHRTFGLAVCAGALLALLSAVSGDAQAQSAVITGKVTGRGGEALGGATVLVEGLGISAGTAQSGSYTLTVPADKAKGPTVTLRARDRAHHQIGLHQPTLPVHQCVGSADHRRWHHHAARARRHQLGGHRSRRTREGSRDVVAVWLRRRERRDPELHEAR